MLIVITDVAITLMSSLQLKVTVPLTIMVAVEVKLSLLLLISRKVKPFSDIGIPTVLSELKICVVPFEISSCHIMAVSFDIQVKTTVVPGHTVALLESFVTS